jgi:hypothetical protein
MLAYISTLLQKIELDETLLLGFWTKQQKSLLCGEKALSNYTYHET